ncbi:MAG: zinc ribbon domain-containing protein [Clostridiales bacterium]|nr:zinc ribbon domain-containing protein [Clostridiales bacterium]
MALIDCPNCGNKISDSAVKCVHCGCELSICPDCGNVEAGENTICSKCGCILLNQVANSKSNVAEQPNDTSAEDIDIVYNNWKKDAPVSSLLYRIIYKSKAYISVLAVIVLFVVLAVVVWLIYKLGQAEKIQQLMDYRGVLSTVKSLLILLVIVFVLQTFYNTDFFFPYYSYKLRKKQYNDVTAIKEIYDRGSSEMDKQYCGFATLHCFSMLLSKNKNAMTIQIVQICAYYLSWILKIVGGYLALNNLAVVFVNNIVLDAPFDIEYIGIILLVVGEVLGLVVGYIYKNQINDISRKWANSIGVVLT